jgi:hypothetical protein
LKKEVEVKEGLEKFTMKRFVGIDLTKRTMEVCIVRDGQKIDRHGLPIVPLITDGEEDMRELVTMYQFLSGQRVAVINRLHAL